MNRGTCPMIYFNNEENLPKRLPFYAYVMFHGIHRGLGTRGYVSLLLSYSTVIRIESCPKVCCEAST